MNEASHPGINTGRRPHVSIPRLTPVLADTARI